MFCKKCGSQIEDGAGFCKKCGAPVEQVNQPRGENRQASAGYLKTGIIVVCLLTSLSSFLPFYKVNSMISGFVGMDSISWIKIGNEIGDGVILIVLAGLTILLTCMNKKLAVLVFGIITFVFYWAHMILFQIRFSEMEEEAGGYIDAADLMSKGPGYYLMLVSVMSLFILCILYFRQKRKDSI